MKSKIIAFFGILLFASALTRPALAETRQLSWGPVTTYTDGTPIEAENTVSYRVCWANDPGFAAGTVHTLVSSTTATSATFDPAAEGMSDYQTIYFAVNSVLATGEESALSDVLPWTPLSAPVSAGVPIAPATLGVNINSTSTSSGTWKLFWDPVTTYTDGTLIEGENTVSYTVCWSNDPWLAADTLHTLVSSGTATSAAFDPAAQGMSDYQTIYFAVNSVLATGEKSALSDVLPWTPLPATVSAGVPMAPVPLGITNSSTSTSSGTWELFWDPVTKDTNGNTIEGNTVRYTLYWTTDAQLSPALLTPLVSSTTATSATFDPAAVGMTKNQRVFFTAKTVLGTGEESALSAALSWRASSTGPGAPGNGRMVKRNKK